MKQYCYDLHESETKICCGGTCDCKCNSMCRPSSPTEAEMKSVGIINVATNAPLQILEVDLGGSFLNPQVCESACIAQGYTFKSCRDNHGVF